jgi:hypothetical protein
MVPAAVREGRAALNHFDLPHHPFHELVRVEPAEVLQATALLAIGFAV